MSANANYFKLGLFILLGLALGVAGVLVLGAGRFLEKRIILETYLDQSVQGVDIGSKVKFRGVPVGNIRKIDFTRNRYELDKPPQARRSYVRLEIEMSMGALGDKTKTIIDEELPREIKNGLRARLTSQGVTGTSYLEVDYLDPARNPPLPIDWVPEYPYIPSAPSTYSRIVNSAEDVFSELGRIDFERIANSVELLVMSLDSKVSELPLGMLGTNATGLLNEVRDSNQRIQKLLERPEIDSMLKDASGAMAGLRRTAESPELTNSVVQLQRTLRRLDQLIAGKENDLALSLDNLRVLTENLKELSENAKRFPAQLFFGEPPKPSRTLP